MNRKDLPLPPHFNRDNVGEVWRVPYQERAEEAEKWAKQRKIQPAANDTFRICLLLVDVQNTFCIPGSELYVGGRSGTGAVDDNRRLCEFIYRNLDRITEICPTMDTHQALQIFHSTIFHEFVLRLKAPAGEVLKSLEAQGILGGLYLAPCCPDLGSALLVCAMETKTPEDLGRYSENLARIVDRRYPAAPCAIKPGT